MILSPTSALYSGSYSSASSQTANDLKLGHRLVLTILSSLSSLQAWVEYSLL